MKPSQIKATLQMGKAGLTDALVEELRAQMKKHKVVKIKLLRSAREELSPKAVAQELAKRTQARVLDVRGGTAVLAAADYRPTD